MRVAIWVPGDPSSRSGGYEYDRRLAQALEQQGHQVDLVSVESTVPVEGPWDLIIQDELGHARFLAAPGWRHGPVLALVHHLKAREERSRWINRWHQGRERRYLSRVDGYLYNSFDTQRVVEALVPGAKAKPHRTHIPGLALPPESRHSRFRTQQPPTLFSLGAITKRKGQLRVARALASVGAQDWRWIVAGPDDVEPHTTRRLRQWIRRQGWNDRVVIRGWVDEPVREALWSQSDLFVLPADYEGFGMAALEASARGLPVISGNRGGIDEVIIDGWNGLRVGDSRTLTQALDRLISDPALRRRWGQAGQERGRSHPTWDQTFQGLGDFLETIVSSYRSSQP